MQARLSPYNRLSSRCDIDSDNDVPNLLFLYHFIRELSNILAARMAGVHGVLLLNFNMLLTGSRACA